MKTLLKIVLLSGFCCAFALSATAETGRYEFSRYDVILTRKPFGDAVPPPGAQPTAQAENDAFKDLMLVSIVESEAGEEIVIGLVNKITSNSYRIPLGEVVDGLEVLDVDFDEEKAQIRKEGFDRWLTLGGVDAGGGLGAGYESSAGSTDPEVVARREAAVERARRRRETVRRREVEPPKMTEAQLETHLKEYQMDLIRKGEPPLPIPLTQDMDDQLVKEGVLPPSQ